MKTIAKAFTLATTGKILQIPLLVLMRAAGTGEQSEGELPAEVLDSLHLNLMQPGVSGAVHITRDDSQPLYYEVDGSVLTVYLSGLAVGVNRLKVLASFGTNTRAQLIVDLKVPENVLWLRSDEVDMPLERMPEKDGERDGVKFYAFAYQFGEEVAWLSVEDTSTLAVPIVALYGDMETELADATELTNARLVRNANRYATYDQLEEVDLAPVESFGAKEVVSDVYKSEDGKVLMQTIDGETYVIGMGGFDGTNPDEAAPATEAEWYGTQEEYDAIEDKNPNITYYIYEEE